VSRRRGRGVSEGPSGWRAVLVSRALKMGISSHLWVWRPQAERFPQGAQAAVPGRLQCPWSRSMGGIPGSGGAGSVPQLCHGRTLWPWKKFTGDLPWLLVVRKGRELDCTAPVSPTP